MGACIQLGLPVLVLITAFAFHLRRLTVFGCGERGLKEGLRDEQQGGRALQGRPPPLPRPPTCSPPGCPLLALARRLPIFSLFPVFLGLGLTW